MKALNGQVAIVTGGGSGIGEVTARMLAAEGAQVVICGRRQAPVDAVARSIEKDGGLCVARAVDLENVGRRRRLRHVDARALRPRGRADQQRRAQQPRALDPLGRPAGVGQRDGRQPHRRVRPDPGRAAGHARARQRHHRHGRLAGRAQGRADRRRRLRRGQGGGAQPHGPRAQHAAQPRHPRHAHHAGRGRHADPRQAPAQPRRRRPRHDDAGRGRGARDHAGGDAAAADRDRGDRHEPHHPARPEPRPDGRGQGGRARREPS